MPVVPPVSPMLGRLVRELPFGDYLYEPKWDGFRCIAFRNGDSVELRSRNDRPLARYFPELVAGLKQLELQQFVIDGEIIVEGEHGYDFTADPAVAAAWLQGLASGVDGVMAKPRDLTYRSGQRAMLKVKLERTLDCVVAGFRLLEARPLPSSLLLGLYDEDDVLQHVGIAGSFSERLRQQLLDDLRPLVVRLGGHPWERGFLMQGSPVGRLKGAAGRWSPTEMSLDWVPVEPTRVAEVSYDHIDARRLRHPARFRRWRPDRDPRSCTFEQL
jgi:ATP-dependent DNA ligase